MVTSLVVEMDYQPSHAGGRTTHAASCVERARRRFRGSRLCGMPGVSRAAPIPRRISPPPACHESGVRQRKPAGGNGKPAGGADATEEGRRARRRFNAASRVQGLTTASQLSISDISLPPPHHKTNKLEFSFFFSFYKLFSLFFFLQHKLRFFFLKYGG